MNYERKYKDALSRAEEIIKYYKEHNRGDEAAIEDLEVIFPELRESDDEKKKMRKIRVIDEGKAEMDYCFTKMMAGEKVTPTWSEEVDLEKEFYNFLGTLIGKDNGHLSEDELFRIAEYFYELGLKVKGE